MLFVGLSAFIGFFAVMSYDIKGSDDEAKAARRYRWAGVGLGALFFAFVWGALYLFGRLNIKLSKEAAYLWLFAWDAAWIALVLYLKKRDQAY